MSNAFIGKAEAPSDAELAVELGSAKARWDRLCSGLELMGEWRIVFEEGGLVDALEVRRAKYRILITGRASSR